MPEVAEEVEEIMSILDDVVNPFTKVIEMEDDEEDEEDCDCEKCKTKKINCEDCEDCITKSYESDDQDLDKWDNIQKACWSGYKQVGMKNKNGKQVPNCVPIKKSIFGSEGPQKLIPRNK